MEMDIGVGNREQFFPTPAGSGDVLALGHLFVRLLILRKKHSLGGYLLWRWN